MTVLFVYPPDHNDGPEPVTVVDSVHVLDDEQLKVEHLHKAPPRYSETLYIAETLETLAIDIKAHLIVPCFEDAVLPCGYVTTKLGLKKGIDLDAALRCVDRKLQRESLPDYLNPVWRIDTTEGLKFPIVAKTPASAANSGVTFLEGPGNLPKKVNKETSILNSYYTPTYHHIFEEYYDAPQWEVNGVIYGNNCIKYFHPLRQVWNEQNTYITEYIPELPAKGLLSSTTEAIKALRLNSCTFGVELRGPPWKVIEVHARLGEELESHKNYIKKMSPMVHPIYIASKLLAEV